MGVRDVMVGFVMGAPSREAQCMSIWKVAGCPGSGMRWDIWWNMPRIGRGTIADDRGGGGGSGTRYAASVSFGYMTRCEVGWSRYTASKCLSLKEPFRGYRAHSPGDGDFRQTNDLDGGQAGEDRRYEMEEDRCGAGERGRRRFGRDEKLPDRDGDLA